LSTILAQFWCGGEEIKATHPKPTGFVPGNGYFVPKLTIQQTEKKGVSARSRLPTHLLVRQRSCIFVIFENALAENAPQRNPLSLTILRNRELECRCGIRTSFIILLTDTVIDQLTSIVTEC
jgi:hypothetical protein